MVGDVDAVVEQFHPDVLVELLEVDALLQGLVAGGIEDAVDHFVEQRLLIYVSVADYLLKRLLGGRDGVLVGLDAQALRHLLRAHSYRLEFERGVDGAVVAAHGVLVGVLYRAAYLSVYGVILYGFALGIVDVFLKEAQRLVHLQIVRSLIESPRDGLVELLALHLGHILHIGDLKGQKSHERGSHDDGDNPDC